ncbi:MAG: epoxyqueuosine reductase QueH [Dehalococcoidales bacterium]|nr:epoxyqueuosine reductase QueH [Dehalococcoidales bacterium]
MNILLHICCGICAAGVVERLITEGHKITGLFYNPNIHPPEEYDRRLEVARRVAQKFDFPLEEVPYTPEEWLWETKSLANEPEGGRRCAVCFRLRLQTAYAYMERLGMDVFATTLTISPHKQARVVNRIGREIGGDKFLERDFKKQAGFQRAIALAQELSLYRQHYCGCRYSIRMEQGR